MDGQVADPERLDNDPFIRQVMRDVDAIAVEKQDEARPEPPAPDLSGQPVTREGDTITIGNGEPTHEIDIKQVAITKAEAEAQKTSIAADAQAEANRKIAESLSDTLIEYQKIQKWDGKLPTVSGGNALVSIDPAE